MERWGGCIGDAGMIAFNLLWRVFFDFVFFALFAGELCLTSRSLPQFLASLCEGVRVRG